MRMAQKHERERAKLISVNVGVPRTIHRNGEEVTTVEGLAEAALERAFVEEGGAQCGICTPGMMCAAVALLSNRPLPTLAEVRTALAGNLCRCTGYTKIFAAVLRAAAERAQGGA